MERQNECKECREMENINMYVCKKMRLCSYLLREGFHYIKIVQDKNNSKYNCWLFKRTPELMNAIEEYYLERERNIKENKDQL